MGSRSHHCCRLLLQQWSAVTTVPYSAASATANTTPTDDFTDTCCMQPLVGQKPFPDGKGSGALLQLTARQELVWEGSSLVIFIASHAPSRDPYGPNSPLCLLPRWQRQSPIIRSYPLAGVITISLQSISVSSS